MVSKAEYFEKKARAPDSPLDKMRRFELAGLLYSMGTRHDKAADCFVRASEAALSNSKLDHAPTNTKAHYGELEAAAKAHHRATGNWPRTLDLALASSLEKTAKDVSKKVAQIAKHDSVGGAYKRYFSAKKATTLSLTSLGPRPRKMPVRHEVIFEISPNDHNAVMQNEVERVAGKLTKAEIREELRLLMRGQSEALGSTQVHTALLAEPSIPLEEAVKKFGKDAARSIANHRILQTEHDTQLKGAHECVEKLANRLGEKEKESLLSFISYLPYAHAAYHHYSPR